MQKSLGENSISNISLASIVTIFPSTISLIQEIDSCLQSVQKTSLLRWLPLFLWTLLLQLLIQRLLSQNQCCLPIDIRHSTVSSKLHKQSNDQKVAILRSKVQWSIFQLLTLFIWILALSDQDSD